MSTNLFHPAVKNWFNSTFNSPTQAQVDAWPVIKNQQHTLIAAPTGSGKTLAAFLSAIDDLVKLSLDGELRDETLVLYVSPLKALSNDIRKNLEEPLHGISDHLLNLQLPATEIRAQVRTGDTPQHERNRMRVKPPHILVTTPESLFILLTSDSGRNMLKTVKTVIIDEIHALAGNKRGSHLSLSMERLAALTKLPPVRIGLSATQKPIELVARFLIGNRNDPCNILDSGHIRQRDLDIEVPGSPLEAVMSAEVWQELYDRLQVLIEQHKTTLIFVNTRRLAERAARFLAERLGDEFVTSHHGSLAREHRLNAEQRLKRGELKALVATASLELGIDIGDVDLVCQLGSPRSISAYLQRVGRSGHQVNAIPKGRLFPLTRDDLVECSALLDAVRHDELDELHVPVGHLDVLSQQLIAEVTNREWHEDDIYMQFKSSYPYRDITKEIFNDVIRMLSEGYSTRRGRRSRYIHYDSVNKLLRPARGAKITAVTNGGAIPDQFDYDVVLEPEGQFIGTLNEDFAFESTPGDIFQLGNTSYRILKVEQGKVRVQDAQGQPPNIPFWMGEAPGRTDELSHAVSRLRHTLDSKLRHGTDMARDWLSRELGLNDSAASQLCEYLAITRAALGRVPTQTDIVFERFFDEAGDQHLVIHSPYGSRINRAWGLGLRKKFCRQFNFELQAAALEDSIVISLGATHSFPLDEVKRYVNSGSIREVVIQAMLAAPMFPTHWRWNATISLAVKRNINGKKVPAIFQRSDAEDLMAVVFPDQLACQENLAGEREVPDHPLVKQTVEDCLTDVMDIAGLTEVLKKIENDKIKVHCLDLHGPSPLAQEILTARPYAFLDDAPAEERRTQAVTARRFMDIQEASELCQLSQDAINRVKQEAWPNITSADELYDALMLLGVMTEDEGKGDNPQRIDYRKLMDELTRDSRATLLSVKNKKYWVCADRFSQALAIFTDPELTPNISTPDHNVPLNWEADKALLELVRGRLECCSPVDEYSLINLFCCKQTEILSALMTLESEGFAMRGKFTGQEEHTEWSERGLLARMHRYTIKSLRNEIKPVSAAEYMRFLFTWHSMPCRTEGIEAVMDVIDKLEGFSIPAAAWENDILPARIKNYMSTSLDQLCSTGRIIWTRLNSYSGKNKSETPGNKSSLIRNTPVSLINRQFIDVWQQFQSTPGCINNNLSANAQHILDILRQEGALFFVDMVNSSGLLRTHVEEALAELAAGGLITSDSFAGLRSLITPSNKRPGFGRHHRRRRLNTASNNDIDNTGRWSLLAYSEKNTSDSSKSNWITTDTLVLNHIAYTLLKRYGIVFRKVLDRESNIPPWRELLYAYRRMEARGEIRGGRFVEGFAGEQFALPDAIGLLRKQRNNKDALPSIIISATDPLNLVGIILPGERIPMLHTNRILFKNGLPVAKLLNDKIEYLEQIDNDEQWAINNLLTRRANPGKFIRNPSLLQN